MRRALRGPIHECPSSGAMEGINKLTHFTETKKTNKNPKKRKDLKRKPHTHTPYTQIGVAQQLNTPHTHTQPTNTCIHIYIYTYIK